MITSSLGFLPWSCNESYTACELHTDVAKTEAVFVQKLINVFSRSAGFSKIPEDGVITTATVAAANKMNQWLVTKKVWAPQTYDIGDLVQGVVTKQMSPLIAAAITKAQPSGWESAVGAINVATTTAPRPTPAPGPAPGADKKPSAAGVDATTKLLVGAALVVVGFIGYQRFARPRA